MDLLRLKNYVKANVLASEERARWSDHNGHYDLAAKTRYSAAVGRDILAEIEREENGFQQPYQETSRCSHGSGTTEITHGQVRYFPDPDDGAINSNTWPSRG